MFLQFVPHSFDPNVTFRQLNGETQFNLNNTSSEEEWGRLLEPIAAPVAGSFPSLSEFSSDDVPHRLFPELGYFFPSLHKRSIKSRSLITLQFVNNFHKIPHPLLLVYNPLLNYNSLSKNTENSQLFSFLKKTVIWEIDRMLIWPFCLNLHYSDMNLSLNGGNGAAGKGNISTLAIIQRGRKEVLQFTLCAPVVWCLRHRLKPFKMPVHHFLD